ncbi:protein phosphatase 2C [Phlyctema vagabunda]|uniref:Protein phosphatase 2C n=1 Tax=Phlyctema vagabunda TaxID=108571 RepID=A0ABR4PIS9_9HELO
MFGSSSSSPPKDGESTMAQPNSTSDASTAPTNTDSSSPVLRPAEDLGSGEKRSGNGSPQGRPSGDHGSSGEKKRRSSGVGGKASSLIASAKNSLHFNQGSTSKGSDQNASQTPLQKLGRQDPALSVPQGQHNNSAGESLPGPRSTFRVGVWEDKNKKCRRTMEDTHAFLYNFLHTPAPALGSDSSATSLTGKSTDELVSSESSTTLLPAVSSSDVMETDNGYFAIFDGHAGTFAADWCGKKLHIILEETIRKNPNTPIPELLDQTFTTVDAQLEKLPLKNSGCTAVTAVLRWEDRIPNAQSATGSTAIAPAAAAAVKAATEAAKAESKDDSGADTNKPQQSTNPTSGVPSAAVSGSASGAEAHAKLKNSASRQRVLYTANVGDARIVLCRNGKALRLSYDHKGSDENEGKRVANAGGLILNNRVNGVLAVTRALGDAYMKDLVTGHPYTTETVIQADVDEFIILACDGLWDVCSDQEAVDLIRSTQDPINAAKQLVDHALARFSTDNLSCMVVRLDKSALISTTKEPSAAIGVEGDPACDTGKMSEVEKIIREAKRKVEEDGVPGVGVSGSNSGKGHDPVAIDDDETSKRVSMEKVVEEEPSLVEGDSIEVSNDISNSDTNRFPRRASK